MVGRSVNAFSGNMNVVVLASVDLRPRSIYCVLFAIWACVGLQWPQVLSCQLV